MGDSYVSGVTGLPFRAVNEEQARDLAESPGVTPVSGAQARKSEAAQKNLDWAAEVPTSAKALMGVGGGITIGLGPAAMAKLGLIDPESLTALQDTGAYQVGDIAGMLAPALLSGGEAVAERGLVAKALGYTPAGIMNALGSGAERLAAGVLPETVGGGMASSAIGMMARGSAEGAMMNMAHTVSDNIVHDAPLTASAIAASGLDGALFGGLAGGATGLAGGLLSHVGGAVAGRESLGAGRVLNHIGADTGDVLKMSAAEGGVPSSLKAMGDVLKGEGLSISSGPKEISVAMKRAFGKYQAIRNDVVQTLEREAPTSAPNIDRLIGTLGHEVPMEDLSSLAAKLEKFKVDGKPPTWSQLVKLRDSVESVAARNVMDRELGAAIKGAEAYDMVEKGLAGQLSASQAGMSVSRHMSAMTEAKAARDLLGGSKQRPIVSAIDIGRAAVGTALGHPIGSAGYLAGKSASRVLGRALEPKLVELAYMNAISAETAGTVAKVRTRIQKAVGSFLQAPRKGASEYQAMTRKEPKKLTRADYEAAQARTEDLLSQAHQGRVQDLANQIAQNGHPDVAKEMVELNARAAQYLQVNLPPNRKVKGMQSLRPLPVPKGMDMKEFKFMRIDKALKDPLSLLDKLEDGSLSKDEVRAVKYVYPPLHAELVSTAQRGLMELKAKGEYVPMENIVKLGVLLDSPLDRTLESDYVNGVQAALNKPVPEEGAQNKPAPSPGPGNIGIDTGLLTPIDRQLVG